MGEPIKLYNQDNQLITPDQIEAFNIKKQEDSNKGNKNKVFKTDEIKETKETKEIIETLEIAKKMFECQKQIFKQKKFIIDDIDNKIAKIDKVIKLYIS